MYPRECSTRYVLFPRQAIIQFRGDHTPWVSSLSVNIPLVAYNYKTKQSTSNKSPPKSVGSPLIVGDGVTITEGCGVSTITTGTGAGVKGASVGISVGAYERLKINEVWINIKQHIREIEQKLTSVGKSVGISVGI